MVKALIVERYSKTMDLRLAEVAAPDIGAEDVLVRVHAASINPLDLRVASGQLKMILAYKPPFVLGHDVAGVVARVGASVTEFREGDEVYGRARDGRIGTFAEWAAVPAGDLAAKPRNISMAEAAAIPLVGLTAWQVLVGLGRIEPGQRVLIQAGSGGVGTLAIQLARHLGATVVTTASAASVHVLEALGAHQVVDYRSKALAAIDPCELVLHSQDRGSLIELLALTTRGGHLVSISGPPDREFAARQNLGPLLANAIGLLAWPIRRRAGRDGVNYSFWMMHASGEQLACISRCVEAGVLRPLIDRCFTFERIHDAIDHVATGRAKGKVVVEMT